YVSQLDTELLFATLNGDTFTHTAYRRMFSKFVNAMGSNDITAHIFRHNFATILYNAGVDIKSAQNILGHSSISMTMDIYTHLDSKNKLVATSKLNSFLLD
ncbi:MAG: tyrosine-type recombinase/integrase, partial [Defluviitaleaceae bacterium]|nr:tyrosine-type recombinase/integrase [Defluviitaleaceae bacterium]MCL2275998.1 tyrosine-type recombinase/integrase [Defluviitaleaceae bacterium]